jgi:type I restriction enzyme M protein
MKRHPRAADRRMQTKMRKDLSGIDIVPDVVRLCAMNLYLRGAATTDSPIERADALSLLGSVHCDMVLTNRPFGRKQGDDGEIESEREEYNHPAFIKTTSNNSKLPSTYHVSAKGERSSGGGVAG